MNQKKGISFSEDADGEITYGKGSKTIPQMRKEVSEKLGYSEEQVATAFNNLQGDIKKAIDAIMHTSAIELTKLELKDNNNNQLRLSLPSIVLSVSINFVRYMKKTNIDTPTIRIVQQKINEQIDVILSA